MATEAWVMGAIAILTGIIGALTTFLQARSKNRLDQTADERTGLHKLIDMLQAQVTSNSSELITLRNELLTSARREADCMKESAEQKGRIILLERTVQQLQMKAGDTLSGIQDSCIIVADITGKIKQASIHILPMFHWKLADIIGKNVTVLIPERFRDKHTSAMTEVTKLGSFDHNGRIVPGYGLTKDGVEFPVTVTLSGWQENGQWLLSAAIKCRILDISNSSPN